MNLLKKLCAVLSIVALLGSTVQAQEMSAVETAEMGVNTLLETVAESKDLFLSDREQYFQNVENVLNTFVDFNAVAEVVMSRYASNASEAQLNRFADILKTTLTRFYGASLVSYNGEELVFLPPSNPNADPRADTVVGMELRGDTQLVR